MKITVVFLGRASELVGKSIIEIDMPENSTLKDLLEKIGEMIDQSIYRRFVEGHYVFVTYINDKPVVNPNTVLKDNDRVVLITPEMGG
uniref:Molybdopterin converting factor n=1 Tax=Staphylothermus marinus TaxID=2280 RepID=A0A7C4HET4_STAMA